MLLFGRVKAMVVPLDFSQIRSESPPVVVGDTCFFIEFDQTFKSPTFFVGLNFSRQIFYLCQFTDC
jgi:hypothetical protein